MVLKLDDHVPIVWRTPTCLQFGIDAPRVVLDDVGAAEERLIAALRHGISPSGWNMLARDSGVGAERADAMLTALEPVLSRAAGPASGRALVLGDGPIASAIAAHLNDAGRLAPAAERMPDLVVLVAPWVVGPEDAQHWLRRDVPHLPVVAADRSVTVGPLVEPGSGPCLYCVNLGRSDEDAAWPVIATQLWGRAAPPMSTLTVSSVAAFAARLVLARLDAGAVADPRVWRIADEGGTISASGQRRHPRCSCAAPPESDWAPGAGRGVPAPTRSGRAGSVPA